MKLNLRVLSGMQIGDQGRIEAPGGFIGRSDGCALHLRDESVSRSHMELRYQQDGWWAYQHSARSLSTVDGVPVGSSPLALQERGVLQVGKVSVEYSREGAPEAVPFVADDAVVEVAVSPPTMVNVRRVIPTIRQAVLPQMTPLRAVDPQPLSAPPTLILRRQPEAAPAATPLTPPTPPTLIGLRAPASAPVPPPPPLAQREPPGDEPPRDEPAPAAELARVQEERDQLRRERDRLAAELQQLSQENERLREAQAQRPVAVAPQAPGPAPSRLAAQAIELLRPFNEALEQTAQALQDGDAPRARSLLREASFGLADLRDLFDSADS